MSACSTLPPFGPLERNVTAVLLGKLVAFWARRSRNKPGDDAMLEAAERGTVATSVIGLTVS